MEGFGFMILINNFSATLHNHRGLDPRSHALGVGSEFGGALWRAKAPRAHRVDREGLWGGGHRRRGGPGRAAAGEAPPPAPSVPSSAGHSGAGDISIGQRLYRKLKSEGRPSKSKKVA